MYPMYSATAYADNGRSRGPRLAISSTRPPRIRGLLIAKAAGVTSSIVRVAVGNATLKEVSSGPVHSLDVKKFWYWSVPHCRGGKAKYFSAEKE
jgi:hypothetical protein